MPDPQRRLDPQVRALIERSAREPAPPGGIEARRRWYRTTRIAAAGDPPEAVVTNHWIDAPGGPVAVRGYRPEAREPVSAAPPSTQASSPLPAMLWLHGGGWTMGDLDTHDVLCRGLARQADCAVFAVDYRLAPEQRFPAGLEDAITAFAWMGEESGALDIDPRRLAIGGDSAGANLAAAAALALRGAKFAPRFQALLYPAVDLRARSIEASASYREFEHGPMLTRADMQSFIAAYLNSPADAEDWRASPMAADSLAGAAPAYVLTAGFDPLRDEGEAYAARLTADGVAATHECFEGQIHGFALLAGELAAVRHALYRVAQYMRLALRET